MAANDLRALVAYRGLLRGLVQRDLTVKYKGSLLGVAWSLLHPLVMAAVYTLAFRYVVKVPIERFPLFLLSGLLPWMFFAGALGAATSSIADNGTLVRKVAFPRAVLPLAAVASALVQFALMYTVLVPTALVMGGGISFAWAALLPVMALQAAFTAGLGLLLATAYVFVRDARHLLDVGLQVWFWLTPIVYAASLAPERLRKWLQLNPMLHFVTAYQEIVTHHVVPSAATFALLLAMATVALSIGWTVFARAQKRFAEYV
ncbi:MAG TPA: ABC transporter permease [Luteitalea sp.]|nr:ABC transporter permease [Luteitalea sp.]